MGSGNSTVTGYMPTSSCPNQVHILVTRKVVATRWLAPLKGFTAYRANEFLGSHGQAFWQDESYRIWSYIEENPVSAASRLKGGCGQDCPPHSPRDFYHGLL